MHYLKEWDHQLFYFINHSISNRFLDLILPIVRNAKTWIPLYIVLGIYLLYKYKKQAWLPIAYILIVFSLSDSISYQLLKPYFERIRPCQDNSLDVRLLIESCGGKFGFPSNHAANHMGIAISIILLRIFKSKWINALLIFWALIIGLAQIYVGVHYPADILAGYITGASISLLIFYIIRERLPKRILNTTE